MTTPSLTDIGTTWGNACVCRNPCHAALQTILHNPLSKRFFQTAVKMAVFATGCNRLHTLWEASRQPHAVPLGPCGRFSGVLFPGTGWFLGPSRFEALNHFSPIVSLTRRLYGNGMPRRNRSPHCTPFRATSSIREKYSLGTTAWFAAIEIYP